eukprot:4840535-Amphidinium_carterae.2
MDVCNQSSSLPPIPYWADQGDSTVDGDEDERLSTLQSWMLLKPRAFVFEALETHNTRVTHCMWVVFTYEE